ncbi:DUF6520 family protein [Gelidibacter sp.]|uniref:DUF6520 family protein n=1 Tax=Gelidibacter sp. TaxID=2018083 RepID=UPI002C285953|nr:DUF6520 family protein [Gelidibacter sp.]HUH26919.1 DUF6520 family protein [Gelidibacter sp.]
MGILFNHLNFETMKKFKFLMPMMAFVMAIGMAFATQPNSDTGLWVLRNGVPYQLKTNTCQSNEQTECYVKFFGDPTHAVYRVFEDQGLSVPKKGGVLIPYVIMD